MTGWPAAVIVIGLVLTLLIPPPLLDLLGVGYTTAGGTLWSKTHPGSDLIVLGVAAAALRSGVPRAWLTARCRRFPGTIVFAMTAAFLGLYAARVLDAPFTPVIDTYVVPIVLFFGLVDFGAVWRTRLEAVLHGFVALNAVLGIAEFVSGWRLIPVTLGGIEQTADVEPRAFGLLGHPLSSAAIAGLYVVILMMGGSRLPPPWRWAAIALQFLALAAFGGRTALVMAAFCLAVTGCASLLRVLGGASLDIRHCALACLAAPLLVGAVAVAASHGFFSTILERFVSDNGSAYSRQIIFDLFGFMNWQDLLLGPDQDHLATLLSLLGIEAGVESYWLGMLFFCGLLPSLIFFAGYALFLTDVMRQARPAALVALLFLGGIVSSSVSLSTKTATLSHFVAMVLILLPRRAAGPRRATIDPVAPPLWAAA